MEQKPDVKNGSTAYINPQFRLAHGSYNANVFRPVGAWNAVKPSYVDKIVHRLTSVPPNYDRFSRTTPPKRTVTTNIIKDSSSRKPRRVRATSAKLPANYSKSSKSETGVYEIYTLTPSKPEQPKSAGQRFSSRPQSAPPKMEPNYVDDEVIANLTQGLSYKSGILVERVKYGAQTVSEEELDGIVSRLTTPTISSKGGVDLMDKDYDYIKEPVVKTKPAIPGLERRFTGRKKVSGSELNSIVDRLSKMTSAYTAKFSPSINVWVDNSPGQHRVRKSQDVS